MVQTTGPSCCESLGAAIRGSAMLILIAINFGIALLAWEFGWAPRPSPPPCSEEVARSLELLSCDQRSELLLRVFNGELGQDSLADAIAAAGAPDDGLSQRPPPPPPRGRHQIGVATAHAAASMGGRRLGDASAGGLRAVLLFKKPAASTGQLVVVNEGLEVLRAQRQPFAIISAVGPTRTGKSSILGRAFLRGRHENLFQIGSGVTSFTGGVWITSEPVVIDGVRCLIIDTEGFSGVGGLTSRTYEANLFGITYLLSSSIVFNTMFPVDASTVGAMNSHCNHALQMLRELHDAGVLPHRKLPRFLWAVQGFNLVNLRNTGINADDLLGSLRNASSTHAAEASSSAAAVVLGSRAGAAGASTHWLVEHLFASVQLLPVRRPHWNDEVVANLAEHPSSELSKDYLSDADALRRAALSGIQHAHACTLTPDEQRARDKAERRRAARAKIKAAKAKDRGEGTPEEDEGAADTGPKLHDACSQVETWDGPALVAALKKWLKFGHVVEQSDRMSAANATAELGKLETQFGTWLSTPRWTPHAVWTRLVVHSCSLSPEYTSLIYC